MVRSLEASISFSLVNNSDVLGVGIFLPRLVVNVHPASTHAFEMNSPTIHVHDVRVDRGNRHFGGSVLVPPFNQKFFNCLNHFS